MPRQVAIYNCTTQPRRIITAKYCDSFLCRLRGLTFRRSLPKDWGLLLVQPRDGRIDSSIHMLFVFFDLAVVWINEDGKVVDVRLARKWRPAYLPKKPARYVLEMAAGRLGDFQIGDRVSFEEQA